MEPGSGAKNNSNMNKLRKLRQNPLTNTKCLTTGPRIRIRAAEQGVKKKPKVFWGNPVALMLFLVYSQASAAESANSSKTPNESLFYNKIKLKCI